MRLINTATLELEDFTLCEIPQYAILSHTWGQDEVTFQDMIGKDLPRYFKQGYVKITMTCRLAAQRGLQYAWIDTCCIDKTSSAELTEAINSMFDYYANSTVCFAHLADLSPGSIDLRHCRWFTRGWTLQELLAPGTLEFYDQTWTYVGPKSAFVQAIAEATSIVPAAITDPWGTHSYSVATKMSWASRRETTRKEDVSYCLLGIFNVHMPLIYGEGERAFERLVAEIVKRENDLTILAWRPWKDNDWNLKDGSEMKLLPQAPLGFYRSKRIAPLTNDFPELSITNRGLLVSTDIPVRVLAFRRSLLDQFIGIQLGCIVGEPKTPIYLPLRKLGPGLFGRHPDIPLISSEQSSISNILWQENTLNYHIITHSLPRSLKTFQSFRDHAIHVPHQAEAELVSAVPDRLWDPEDRMFLRPTAIKDTYFPAVLATHFQTKRGDSVFVLCDNSTGVPSAGIVSDASANAVMRLLFRGKHREHSLIWADFEALGIEVKFGTSSGLRKDEAGHTLALEQGKLRDGFPPVQISLHGRTLERVR